MRLSFLLLLLLSFRFSCSFVIFTVYVAFLIVHSFIGACHFLLLLEGESSGEIVQNIRQRRQISCQSQTLGRYLLKICTDVGGNSLNPPLDTLGMPVAAVSRGQSRLVTQAARPLVVRTNYSRSGRHRRLPVSQVGRQGIFGNSLHRAPRHASRRLSGPLSSRHARRTSSGSLSPGLSCPPSNLAETGEDHVTPSSDKGLIMSSAEPGQDSTVEASTALEKSVDTPAIDSQQSVVGRSAAQQQCEMTATTYCVMESSNPAKEESEEGQCVCAIKHRLCNVLSTEP